MHTAGDPLIAESADVTLPLLKPTSFDDDRMPVIWIIQLEMVGDDQEVHYSTSTQDRTHHHSSFPSGETTGRSEPGETHCPQWSQMEQLSISLTAAAVISKVVGIVHTFPGCEESPNCLGLFQGDELGKLELH